MVDKNSNLSDQNLDEPSSRRIFLTRASVGAALATIPAKPVWATGLTNSNVASGSSSDFSGGIDLALKLPDQWLGSGIAALGWLYANVTYTASPVINWKLRRCLGGQEYKLRLCHLLGDKVELTHFIEHKVRGKVGSYENNGSYYDIELKERGYNKNKERLYTWEKLIRHLGGEDGSPVELNRYIVSAYLNAKHQALVRARYVYGHAALQHKFTDIRTNVLEKKREISTLRKEVANMREKMRQHLDKSNIHNADLKQTSGGITDLEFLTQYWVLLHSHTHSELTKCSDNLRILDSLAQADIISTSQNKALQEAYLFIRNQLHKLSLGAFGRNAAVPGLEKHMSIIQRNYARVFKD